MVLAATLVNYHGCLLTTCQNATNIIGYDLNRRQRDIITDIQDTKYIIDKWNMTDIA